MTDVKDRELGGVSGAGATNVRYFCPKCSGELKETSYARGLESYTTWECQRCGAKWSKEYVIHSVGGEF